MQKAGRPNTECWQSHRKGGPEGETVIQRKRSAAYMPPGEPKGKASDTNIGTHSSTSWLVGKKPETKLWLTRSTEPYWGFCFPNCKADSYVLVCG